MKHNTLSLNILSAKGSVFSGRVNSVTLPSIVSGSIGIYPNHAPLITVLGNGKLSYYTEEKEMFIDIEKGGIAEVNDGVVTICIY